MAKLNGVSLKSITSYEGMEGEGYAGSLYLNDTKIGSWTQDTTGSGEDYFSIPQKEYVNFQKAVLKMKSSIKKQYIRQFFDENQFMFYVLSLCLAEKEYKKQFKKGFTGIAIVLLVEENCCTWLCYKPNISDVRQKVFLKLRTDLEKSNIKLNINDIIFIENMNMEGFNIELGDENGFKKEFEEFQKRQEEIEVKAKLEARQRKKKDEEFKKLVDKSRYQRIEGGIRDIKTGKTVEVPLYALSEAYKAIVLLTSEK